MDELSKFKKKKVKLNFIQKIYRKLLVKYKLWRMKKNDPFIYEE